MHAFRVAVVGGAAVLAGAGAEAVRLGRAEKASVTVNATPARPSHSVAGSRAWRAVDGRALSAKEAEQGASIAAARK